MKPWRRNSNAPAPPAAPRAAASVDRLLQLNLVALIPLGAIMLGLGDRGTTLALAALAAAVASFFLTDKYGWLKLDRKIANALALLATAFAISNFARFRDEQLVSIADLLIYLQIILLFQQKTVRIYRQLLVLSVLQVVVATALNSSLLFGFLLVVYLFGALAALGLLFIMSEAELHKAGRSAEEPPLMIAALPTRRWPLAREIVVTPVVPPDLPREMLGRGIFWRTARIGFGTLVVAVVCFLFLPRFGKTLAEVTGQQAMIGYNPTVKLGDLGPLLQNSEPVMQVEFFDKSGRSFASFTPPLWRGSVLNYYRHGEWKLLGPYGQQRERLKEPPAGAELVRERITIQPMQEIELFAVYPPYRSDMERNHVRYDPDRQHLYRYPSEWVSKGIEYEVVTTGLAGGHQARIVPMLNPKKEKDMNFLLQMPDRPPRPNDLTISPAAASSSRDRLDNLRKLAADKIREFKIPDDDAYGKAKQLERVLSSPPFEYSLDRGPSDPALDPIEDFITRNPRGHCEYFASALALMLRSQNIPARVVIGFHGGEFISTGSYYDVRQLHAHAWVEAYLTPDQLEKVPPAELPKPSLPPGEGAWLVLDPTPAQDVADPFAQGTLLSSLADLSDYVQVLWNTYVVGLNSDRQDRVVYGPLTSFGQAMQDLVADPKQTVSDMFVRLKHWLFGGGDASEGGFDWYVLAALAVLAIALYIAYRVLRLVVRACWRLVRWRRTRRTARSRIQFYRRFETLLARHGIERTAEQTQLELAARVATHITAVHGPSRASAIPASIVGAFYGIRFGGQPLDAATAGRLEHALSDLNAALSNSNGRLNGNGKPPLVMDKQ